MYNYRDPKQFKKVEFNEDQKFNLIKTTVTCSLFVVLDVFAATSSYDEKQSRDTEAMMCVREPERSGNTWNTRTPP